MILSVPWCFPAFVSLADTEPPQQLEEMVVTATAEPSRFYEPEAYGATRSEVPLMETPQSVRVIGEQQLEDVSAVRVSDTFDYVSGISRQNSFSDLWENYAVRGFSGDSRNAGLGYLLNGFAANRGFNAPRDSANVESIEFLKGPSAALFGASDPGGTLNVVTKKPRWEREHEISTTVGSFDFFRQTLGSTGPLTDEFAYRFDAAFEDSNSFRDFIGRQRQFIAPAFTWKAGDRTTLEYNAEFLSAENDFDRGVFALNGRLGVVPIDRFFGEPNDAPFENDNLTNQLRLTHELDDDWSLRAGVSSKVNSLYGFSTETRNVFPDGTMRRRYRFRDYDSQDWSAQVELHGKFKAFGMEHTVLTGADAFTFENDQLLLSGNYAVNLDVFNPVYGQPKPALSSTIRDHTEHQDSIAVFVQDQISLSEHWKLLLGLRAENYHQRMDDRVAGRESTQHYTPVIPRAAITWLPTKTLSTYFSYSESFRPSQGTDQNFDSFEPEYGTAYEIGVKYQREDGKLGATLAVFDIRKENVLVMDPTDPSGTFLVNGGKAGSRGVEFDLGGQLTDSFRISSALTWMDARVLESSVLREGSELLNIPRFMANVLGIQEFELPRGGKIGVGGGVVHVGARSGEEGGNFELPAYTTFKALSYWQCNENLRFTLDVDNLFDETHYVSSVSQSMVQPGSPRTVTFGMSLNF
jgi:iron complex outermembrane receptor protein